MVKGRYKISIIMILCFFTLLTVIGCQKIDATESNAAFKEETSKEQEETKGIKGVSPYVYKVYEAIPQKIQNQIMGGSFKEDGPIAIEELAYIEVAYWSFDEKKHMGEIIVHKKLANEVVDIFKTLYEAKFPIEKIRLIDEYGASDERSMADNNTSALCVRPVTGYKDKYSNHSYGIAIDINPVQNPYVKGDTVLPEEGNLYKNRQNVRKGMIIKGDVVYKVFKKYGWTWGGDWNSLKDYQHFEKKTVIN